MFENKKSKKKKKKGKKKITAKLGLNNAKGLLGAFLSCYYRSKTKKKSEKINP